MAKRQRCSTRARTLFTLTSATLLACRAAIGLDDYTFASADTGGGGGAADAPITSAMGGGLGSNEVAAGGSGLDRSDATEGGSGSGGNGGASNPGAGGETASTDAGPSDSAATTCAPTDSSSSNQYCVGGVWLDPPPGMVAVRAGPFSMGCNEALDVECDADEFPYHTVDLDVFAIDRTEVRRSEYGECAGAGVCVALPDFDPYGNDCGEAAFGIPVTDQHPANCVTWAQAEQYCVWRNKRLPTEAEWEKAARGDDGRVYPWGSEPPDCLRVVMGGCGSGTGGLGHEPVGTKPLGASPFGALDMAGNVFEWVADWYEPSYYLVSPARNPPGPASGPRHVFRSAASNYGADSMRASDRGSPFEAQNPNDSTVVIGFRCAFSPPAAP